MATMHDNNETVAWPKRAVTAGMPYGNKPLHFGHIAGVFVPADCFARFLRDRIGAENVRFISGTDCFGSPINEGYRKLVEAGQFDGTIEDYVLRNHNRQKDTLDSYDISLDIYEGSNIGHSGEVHQLISEAFIKKLYENGWLQKRATLQFYDPEAGTFLNGRQVQGHCPVQGCKSEHAYADECDLGHSYAPEDLIAPKSSLTGVTPEMRPVENWYFDLPAFNAFLKKHVEALEADPEVRPIVPQTIKEFLAPPVVYIKNELYDQYLQIADKLAHHQYHEAEKGKQSFEIEFDTIDDRDAARDVLAAAGIRFRTGKALVPFRITGNIEGREGAGHRRARGPDGVVLARKPVGSHELHHGRQRQDGPAARQLARFLVLGGRAGLPVHRPGQPVLLRRCPAGAHRGAAPGRYPRARRDGCAPASDQPYRQPSHPAGQQEGLVVGLGHAADG